ncbi:MAG: PaaI family thioesterase [Promethearchaeia archaeon]
MNSLDVIKEKFKHDNYANQFGIKLDKLTKEKVLMHMEVNDGMLNFHGTPHGGAIYSLADAAFSVIGNNQNNISVALDCTINYHSAPKVGDILYVRGERIKQTRKIGTYLFKVFKKVEGEEARVATMMSTLYRTGKAHDSGLPVE